MLKDPVDVFPAFFKFLHKRLGFVRSEPVGKKGRIAFEYMLKDFTMTVTHEDGQYTVKTARLSAAKIVQALWNEFRLENDVIG